MSSLGKKTMTLSIKDEASPVLRQVAENFTQAVALLEENRRLLSQLTETPERLLEVGHKALDLAEGVVADGEGEPAA